MPSMHPHHQIPDDVKVDQELLRGMAASLDIASKVMVEKTHKLMDILHPAMSGKGALLINDATMKPVKTLWQTAFVHSTGEWNEWMKYKYQVLSQEFEQFYSYPILDSLGVASVNKRYHQN